MTANTISTEQHERVGETPAAGGCGLEPARLEGETAKSYGRFLYYCRLGSQRSFGQMSQEFGKSPAAFEKMALRYGWHERVRQYDAAVEAINGEAWSLQVKEAAHIRAQEEILRQQRAAPLSEKVYRKLDRLLDVEFVEEVSVEGRRVLKAVNVSQLVPIAHLMREFARISVLAGEFSFGGRMWGDQPMPELPTNSRPRSARPRRRERFSLRPSSI